MGEERMGKVREELCEILASHGTVASEGLLSDLVDYDSRPLELEITVEPLEIKIDKDVSGTWNPQLPLKDGNSLELSRMTTFTVSMQASIKEKGSDTSEGSEGLVYNPADGLTCCPADRDKPFKFYRKLPVEIGAKQMEQSFLIKTLAGTMYGPAGDYLVIGYHGELYPAAADIFDETYESLPMQELEERRKRHIPSLDTGKTEDRDE